jgi:hypothetical protein
MSLIKRTEDIILIISSIIKKNIKEVGGTIATPCPPSPSAPACCLALPFFSGEIHLEGRGALSTHSFQHSL